MTVPAWRELDALFHEALARPPAERAAWLAGRCAGHPELGTQVEAMLRAHDEGRSALNVSATAHSPLQSGTRFGAYEIVCAIGEAPHRPCPLPGPQPRFRTALAS